MLNSIGLYGGSFDPVHNGHIETALAVKKQMGLQRMLLSPAARSPHKSKSSISDEHRLQLLRLAISNKSGLELNLSEIEQPGPSYTIDLLKQFRARFPQHALVFIMGADTWASFESWGPWQRILDLAHLAVMQRSGYALPHVPEWAKKRLVQSSTLIAKTPCGQICFTDAPKIPISSSQIREMIHTHKNLPEALPDNVAAYINHHHLYQ